MTPQELKNSILQLAIQGRLVEQCPEEGTAEELYKQIQIEKEALIKSGKIKKEKPLPEITEDEIPFEVPESWKWVRIGDYVQKVTDYVASGSFASLRENVKYYKEPNYAILVKTKDFQSNFTNDLTYTDKHGYEFLENSRLFGGELIMPNIGASIGKVFKVPYLDSRMTLAPNSILIRFLQDDHLDWFSYFFLSPNGYSRLMSISASTAQAKFSKTEFKSLCIPVPPLAEQKRIVAKIEELLPLIDRYEQAWTRLEDYNKRLPGDMQKSILQMAIQGKLVEQRPEEGTGEELYQQIQREKQALIQAGKLKKQKPLPEIAEDEVPFEIPETWKWVHLNQIAESSLGKTLDKAKNTGELCQYLCSINVYWNGISLEKIKEAKFSEDDKIKYRLKRGDMLICEGGDVGRTAIWDSDDEMYYQNALHRVRFYGEILPYYFKYVIECYKGIGIIDEFSKGMTIKHLVQNSLYAMYLPLPPLAEQKRIVARLEELLPLCEGLK